MALATRAAPPTSAPPPTSAVPSTTAAFSTGAAASSASVLKSNTADYIPPRTAAPRSNPARQWFSAWGVVGVLIWQLSPWGSLAHAVHLPWATTSGNTSNATVSVPNVFSQTPTWNTSEMDVNRNGNMRVAADLIASKGVSSADAKLANIADVAKAPFRYIGDPYQFRGRVAIVQEYSASSDVGRAIGTGKVVSEVVAMDSQLSTAVPMDIVVLGDTGSIHEGDAISIVGYVAGTVDVDNKLGGKTTQLVLVAGNIQRLSR